MEKTNLIKLEKKLLGAQKAYEKILIKIKKYPDYGIGEEDNVQEIEEFEESLGLRKNIEKALKEVGRAIRQIKKGKYGICLSCKKEINPKRLEIYPSATLCVACKSERARRKPWLRFPWRG
ncbi:MAG: DnaK suppressor protein [Candidatus Berkelbacteria bacterium Licking1014_7]|uniref:DnaK suppressor protein n=1 Tax=Candidatus Berkelbacteria bacterium Licking1014_7 TaxID=2017147 RepID=A0A554LKM6_9BACT|nr:MAG: DnaK suppressor protein [Candidatus Berkelbacteria bacterium Licking1014_7]